MFQQDALTQGLDVYRVGGAVRDALLGWPVVDHDWVVVGATPEAMRQRGFKPVGRDFPVFLHPHTAEEYSWRAPSVSPAMATVVSRCMPAPM